jgi:glycosyltransferase involved in cell wall biosynthesis
LTELESPFPLHVLRAKYDSKDAIASRKAFRFLAKSGMKHLRIGIDVHSIGGQKGGNETYYRELIKEMMGFPCDHSFFLYYTNPRAIQQIRASERFRLERLRPSHRILRIPLTLPWHVRNHKLDLFHAQFIVPPFLKCKTVTTIPDIAYEHVPQFFPARQRAWLTLLVRESAKRADHIITVSEYSKRDLVDTYGVSHEKITVTYEGAGEEFLPLDREKAKEDLARKYGIKGEFILYLGRLQARKNLARLVESYAKVRKSGLRHKLVLAGKPDSLFQPVLSRIRELKLENDVVLPGYVQAEDVPTFFNAAEVFVYISYYEGFGLPIMEAMACGTPVVTSRGSALEEVAGDGALLVDPMDEASIAEALTRILSDAGLRYRLGQAGLARSRQFNFKNAAEQTIGVYERVTGSA